MINDIQKPRYYKHKIPRYQPAQLPVRCSDVCEEDITSLTVERHDGTNSKILAYKFVKIWEERVKWLL